MILDHKKYDLFGKTLVHKVVIKPPFNYTFPISDNACFLYMLEGETRYHVANKQISIPARHSLFLNCIHSQKEISAANAAGTNKIVIVNFHPDVLQKVYDREIPFLLKEPKNRISNRSTEIINNDFLIQKYVEGLLFYFDNPTLVNEDILILKLKEILLLLSQTQNAEGIQLILSQLFSPITYSFKQVVDAHIFSPITVVELAKATNLSLSSFKREFAKLYNDTPANYIKNKRLDRAARLLLASPKRVTDVALECGFSDLASFTKSFHDKYDTTPTNYRLTNTAN